METNYAYEVRTARGDTFRIAENGDIQRMDMPGFQPSGQWKMLGLRGIHAGRFTSRFVPLAEVPILLARESLMHKNGSPRFTVEDLDHGTQRTWGNPKYHGVAEIVLHGTATLEVR